MLLGIASGAMAKSNKSAFVRSLPPTMPAADVVKAAGAKGMKLSVKFVHTIRYNAKKLAAKKGGAPTASAPAKRGPGRPRKMVVGGTGWGSSGLVAEIERIVEAKVSALLKERLGGLFGR
jgi:hypothetical protein